MLGYLLCVNVGFPSKCWSKASLPFLFASAFCYLTTFAFSSHRPAWVQHPCCGREPSVFTLWKVTAWSVTNTVHHSAVNKSWQSCRYLTNRGVNTFVRHVPNHQCCQNVTQHWYLYYQTCAALEPSDWSVISGFCMWTPGVTIVIKRGLINSSNIYWIL